MTSLQPTPAQRRVLERLLRGQRVKEHRGGFGYWAEAAYIQSATVRVLIARGWAVQHGDRLHLTPAGAELARK